MTDSVVVVVQDLGFWECQQGEVGQDLDLQEGQVDGRAILRYSGEVERCTLGISSR